MKNIVGIIFILLSSLFVDASFHDENKKDKTWWKEQLQKSPTYDLQARNFMLNEPTAEHPCVRSKVFMAREDEVIEGGLGTYPDCPTRRIFPGKDAKICCNVS